MRRHKKKLDNEKKKKSIALFDSVKIFRQKALFHKFLADTLQLLLTLLFIAFFSVFLLHIKADLEGIVPYAQELKSFISEDLEGPQSMEDMPDVNQGTDIIKGFFYKMFFGVAVLILLLMAISTLFRTYVYSYLNKIPFREFLRDFWKFNIIWHLFWIALSVLSLIILNKALVPFVWTIYFLIYITITPVYRAYIKKEDSYRTFFARLIKKGLFRFYKFIIPFLLIYFLQNIIFALLAFVLVKLLFNTPGWVLFFFTIIYVIFINWARYYLFLVAKKEVES